MSYVRNERSRLQRDKNTFGPVAQLVEQQTFNLLVEGSTPSWLTAIHCNLVWFCRDFNLFGWLIVQRSCPLPCPHRLVRSGHRPFTPLTRVQIPLGTPIKPPSVRRLSWREQTAVLFLPSAQIAQTANDGARPGRERDRGSVLPQSLRALRQS